MREMMIQELTEAFEDNLNVTLTDEMEVEIYNTLDLLTDDQLSDVEIIKHTRKNVIMILEEEKIFDSRDFEPLESFNIYK